MTRLLFGLGLVAVLMGSAGAQTAAPEAAPRPWTDASFLDDPADFQFVIVSDRTGGMQPGVFERAVKKVNLLRPEFVISVGDLIDGYTEDPAVWTAQWDEFDGIVAGLDAPFFYVPGNHDVSNAELEQAWQERHGPTHYSYVYKDVMLLVLNTDEQWPDGGVSDVQVEAVRQSLAENTDVRWTMVFMHRPLFAYGNQAGYERVAALLAGRQHTVFAGHHHHYLKTVRDGVDHFILGTTGGGSYLRGAEFGELDHVAFVTMTDDGPVVANLALDGIHDEDMVDEAAYRLVDPLRKGTWLDVEPVLHDAPEASRLESALLLTNPADRPMRVTGTLAPHGLVRFEPTIIDTTVAPEATLRLPVALVSDSLWRVEAIAEAGVPVTLSASFTRDDGIVLSLPTTREVELDWLHTLPVRDVSVQLDGLLAEWDTTAMLRAYRPAFLQEGWDWKGADDGWFRFSAAASGADLMIAIESFDPVFLDGPIEGRRDKLIVELMVGEGEPLRIEVASGATPSEPLLSVSDPALAVRAASRQRPGGMTAEVSFPLPDGPFRLNVGMMDHDRPENTKPSVLWWRPRGASGGGLFSHS